MLSFNFFSSLSRLTGMNVNHWDNKMFCFSCERERVSRRVYGSGGSSRDDTKLWRIHSHKAERTRFKICETREFFFCSSFCYNFLLFTIVDGMRKYFSISPKKFPLQIVEQGGGGECWWSFLERNKSPLRFESLFCWAEPTKIPKILITWHKFYVRMLVTGWWWCATDKWSGWRASKWTWRDLHFATRFSVLIQWTLWSWTFRFPIRTDFNLWMLSSMHVADFQIFQLLSCQQVAQYFWGIHSRVSSGLSDVQQQAFLLITNETWACLWLPAALYESLQHSVLMRFISPWSPKSLS